MAQQPENTAPMEGASGSWRFDTPLTCLYGGICAILLVIIMVGLLMLACSQCRKRSSGTGGDEVEGGNNPVKGARRVGEANTSSTKMVVIMAGEELPTYLAAPAHAPPPTL